MKKRNENAICGIYALTFGNKIIYIGQSKNIQKRFKEHLRWETNLNNILVSGSLKGYYTPGEAIQYQRYSFIGEHEHEIECKVLEECDEHVLDVNEEYWIKKYKPQFNYEGVYDEYYGQHRQSRIDSEDQGAW